MRGSIRPSRPAAVRPCTLGAALVASVLSSSLAHADNCPSQLVSGCINDDNLWPHAGASHFLTIGGTETTQRGEVGFGLYTTYLSRPIVLGTNAGGQSGATDYAVDNQINGNFMFTYGISERLELDAVVPVTFSQSGSGTSALTGSSAGLQTTGMRDLRFGFAYALVPRRRVDPDAYKHADVPAPSHWSLTGRVEISAPTGDTSGFGSDGNAVWSPSLAADYRRGSWFAGSEIGLRLRPTEEVDGARIGSQAFIGIGIGRDFLPHDLFSVTAEAYILPTFAEQHVDTPATGTTGIVSTPDGQYIAPAEWMLSVRTAPLFGGDLQLQAGGGGSIPFSDNAPITNPRFRVALSVRYAPLGRDSDGDGVVDKDDKCPYVHGLPGNPAGDGCPPSAEHDIVDLTGAPPAAAPAATDAAPPTSKGPSPAVPEVTPR